MEFSMKVNIERVNMTLMHDLESIEIVNGKVYE